MRPASLLFVFILGIGCLAGCRTSRTVTDSAEAKTNDTDSRTPRGQQGIEMIPLFMPEQDGLDRLIEENSRPINSEEASRRLASEAILIRILEEEDLERVLSNLEEYGAAQRTWCGQMMEWRDLLEHPMRNQLMTLNEDLLLFNEGKLTIGARGWIEPSIEGVRTRMELVPRHIPERSETPSLIRNNKVVPHFFDVASVQTELAPGQILMITCTPPLPPPKSENEQTTAEDEASGPAEVETAENDEIPLEVDQRRRGAQSTKPIDRLGHIMFETPSLSSERRARRTALLLIPRIPEGMLPRKHETSEDTQEER
mgnify:CR=1 FL=1